MRIEINATLEEITKNFCPTCNAMGELDCNHNFGKRCKWCEELRRIFEDPTWSAKPFMHICDDCSGTGRIPDACDWI